jgi:hypothetical protein
MGLLASPTLGPCRHRFDVTRVADEVDITCVKLLSGKRDAELSDVLAVDSRKCRE